MIPFITGAGSRAKFLSKGNPEPSLLEVLLFALSCSGAFFVLVLLLGDYWIKVARFGDNSAYIAISSSIRHWDFSSISVKHFWGLPILTALLGSVTGMSDIYALIVICAMSSLVGLVLSHVLFGGLVSSFFLILSWDWLQRSVLGGAEPLFFALLCSSFYASRKMRLSAGSTYAAYATTVRPLGIFMILGFFVTLAAKRKFQQLCWSMAIVAMIGLGYILILTLAKGNPLANIEAYASEDWKSAHLPVSIPFLSILYGLVDSREPITNIVKISFFAVLVISGTLAVFWRKNFAVFKEVSQPEVVFVILYLVFLVSYNSSWAWQEFPRFVIPLLPYILLSLKEWLPNDRRLIWISGIVSAALAAFSAFNVRTVMEKFLGS